MASWTDEQLKSFLLFTDNQDMATINKAIADTVPINLKAQSLKNDWINWWNNLGWYDQNISTVTYDQARNKRNEFFLANATPEQYEGVKNVIKSGQTTEQGEGGTRRSDSEGHYNIPPEPWIPDKYKIPAIIGVTGVATLVVLKKTGVL